MRGFIRYGVALAAGASLAAALFGSTALQAEPAINPLGLEPHHVTAAAGDIDRAVKWYTTTLGFALVDRGIRENGAFEFAKLTIPGFTLALVHVRAPGAPGAPGAPAAPAPVPPAVAGWIHVVFSVADADATFRALKQKGVDVWQRPPPPPGRVAEFLLHDSEGNQIEIVERPAQAKP